MYICICMYIYIYIYMDPAARGDAVRAVDELAWLAVLQGPLVEIGEGVALHDLGVHVGHAVHVVGADDRKVAHPDALATLRGSENRHVADPLAIAPLRLHLLEEHVVDHSDDLHVPGQQLADELDAPLLERLGHHGVVSKLL